jgi:hypothetical protein
MTLQWMCDYEGCKRRAIIRLWALDDDEQVDTCHQHVAQLLTRMLPGVQVSMKAV